MNRQRNSSAKDMLAAIASRHYSWLIVLIAPTIIFGPMLLSGKALFWGTPLLQFVPWREFAFETLRNGHLPLWNPLVGMGAPLIANYQSALFYPPNVLLIITGPVWGQGLLVLVHVVWAGIGMIYLARKLGFGLMAQTVAGLAFSLSGYNIARAGFLSINAAVAWLPWMIAATEIVIREVADSGFQKRAIRPILALSLVLTMQWLAGHAQTAWYSLILMVCWGIWRGFQRRKRDGIIATLGAMLIAGALAFALSAIQLIPVFEYLTLSQRATDLNRELALTYSFWPWRIIGLLIPDVFGNPAHGDYWGYANYWEDAIYIGTLPFVLGVLAVFRGIRKNRWKGFIGFLLILGGLSLILALGKNTPIFNFLFDHVPTFDLFQAPSRWMVIFIFCLSLLAALGAELWESEKLVRLFWVRLGTVGAVTISAVAIFSRWVLKDIQATFVPAIATAGLLLSVTGILAWRRRIRPAPVWPIVICTFVALDLIWAAKGLNPSISAEYYETASQLPNRTSGNSRIYMPAALEYELKFEQTHRFDTFFPEVDWEVVRDVGLPNTAMLEGISSANNFDPLVPRRYSQWIAELEKTPLNQENPILALMNVGWLADDGEQDVYLQVSNPSRVRAVGAVHWAEDDDRILNRIFNGSFDPEREVFIEGVSQLPETSTEVHGTFTILDQKDPNRVQINADLTGDGWVILSDLWFPGWRVAVDGQERPIHRADYIFRAVEVPGGEHFIEFTYRPNSFKWGGWISVLACVIFGTALWTSRTK
jgi:uncharacterized membrane protein YfhO